MIEGQDKFTAGDIGKFTSAFEILNPEDVVCYLDNKIKFEIELTIEKGRGYVPAEENRPFRAGIRLHSDRCYLHTNQKREVQCGKHKSRAEN